MINIQEIPDTMILGHAQQYKDAACYLYGHRDECNIVHPIYVLGAFGIELYLKCLNANWTEDPRVPTVLNSEAQKQGHCLPDLFDAINIDIRDTLDSAYTTSNCVTPLSTDTIGDGHRNASPLKKVLASYDVFRSARYAFEKSAGLPPLDGLMTLLKFLATEIEKMKSKRILTPDLSHGT